MCETSTIVFRDWESTRNQTTSGHCEPEESSEKRKAKLIKTPNDENLKTK